VEVVVRKPSPVGQQVEQARRAIHWPILVALLVVGLVLAVVSFWKLASYRRGVVVTSFVVAVDQPASVVAILPENVDQTPVVLLVHMYSGSKEMMQGIAFALARMGIACYLLDLPGHGASPATFEFGQMENRLAMVRAVYHHLFEEGDIPEGRVAVVGHSMGGRLTGQLALAEAEVDGAVSISGVPFPGISRYSPVNYLILAGGYDLPGVLDWAKHAFQQVGGEEFGKVGTLQGSFRDRTANKLMIISHTDHVLMVFHPVVIREIENWLASVFGLETPISGYEMRIWWLVLIHAALAILFFPLVTLASKWLLDQKTVPARASGDMPPRGFVRVALAFTLGILLSLAVLSVWGPLRFIRLATADYLVSFLALLGLSVYPLVSTSKGQFRVPGDGSLIRRLGVVIFAFLYFYLTLGYLGSCEYFHFFLGPASLSRMLVILPALFVFFFTEEQVVRPLQQVRGVPMALMMSLGINLLLVFVLGMGYQGLHLPHVPSFVMIASPYLAILFVMAALFSSYLFQLTQSVLVTVLFQSSLFAWIFAVVFPRT
jgi:pimeloyl-ACP methyl ester carboxylesterase